MAEEVCSPVSRKGSKVGSGQPISPGARSSPSRATGPQTDSIPPQASHGRTTHGEEPAASMEVIGPED